MLLVGIVNQSAFSNVNGSTVHREHKEDTKSLISITRLQNQHNVLVRWVLFLPLFGPYH